MVMVMHDGMEEEEHEHDPKTCMSQQAMHALFEMRTNNMLCDATIHLQDGSYIHVHRAIMCSCSNYFRALFTTSLTGEKNDVTIPGIRTPIMEKIIDYAYLRKCDIDERNIYELLTVADYVGMMGLVRQCVEYMVNMLSPNNCVGIMLFARAKFCHDLCTKARSYILRNFVEVAVKSQEILKIGLKEFYDIISDDMLNSKDEEPIWECCIRWIDFEPNNRAQHITKLMRGVRLGLLNTRFFMEQVKDHLYVTSCESAKPLIIETLTFLYDLDMIGSRDDEIRTPALALPRLPHEVIFAIGGWSEGLPQRCIETYDTRADRWVRIRDEDPAGPRAYHGTAVIAYRIYCIGGFDGMDYFNTCRVFDAVKKSWKEIAPMHCRRCYVSVAELNGFIYAMGGYDGNNRQNTAERYDPKTNQWTMIAPMSVQRSDASACTLNGKVYITGGFNGQECMNSAECYDPVSNSWSPLPNMISRRSGVSCVAHKGYVYVVGGFNGLSRMNTGERFDPETQSWSSIREMYHPRSNFGLEIIDDMIFAIGGFNGVATIAHAECYVVETDEWLEATDMGIVRSALSVNVIMGLPNVRDYIHKDRERLMEERRQRMFPNEIESEEDDQVAPVATDTIDTGNNNDGLGAVAANNIPAINITSANQSINPAVAPPAAVGAQNPAVAPANNTINGRNLLNGVVNNLRPSINNRGVNRRRQQR